MAFLISTESLARAAFMAVAAAVVQASAGQPAAFDEYQVKAAFLYNFAKFVEWPPAAFKSSDEPIGMCVLGQNPFGGSLEEMVGGKKIGERTFRVRQIAEVRDAAKCHMVFVSAAEEKRGRALSEEIRGLPVLTIGETDSFLADGGIIVFTVKDTRVRFEIQGEVAARARLKISSKLMSLSENARK